VFVYVDDLLVASTDPKSHKIHLSTVFQRLHDHQLQINIEKCVFAAGPFHDRSTNHQWLTFFDSNEIFTPYLYHRESKKAQILHQYTLFQKSYGHLKF
jgi:hypothetical protein